MACGARNVDDSQARGLASRSRIDGEDVSSSGCRLGAGSRGKGCRSTGSPWNHPEMLIRSPLTADSTSATCAGAVPRKAQAHRNQGTRRQANAWCGKNVHVLVPSGGAPWRAVPRKAGVARSRGRGGGEGHTQDRGAWALTPRRRSARAWWCDTDDTANMQKEFHCGTMRLVTIVGRPSASASNRSSEPPSTASQSCAHGTARGPTLAHTHSRARSRASAHARAHAPVSHETSPSVLRCSRSTPPSSRPKQTTKKSLLGQPLVPSEGRPWVRTRPDLQEASHCHVHRKRGRQ
jgi:hypothetical protein